MRSIVFIMAVSSSNHRGGEIRLRTAPFFPAQSTPWCGPLVGLVGWCCVGLVRGPLEDPARWPKTRGPLGDLARWPNTRAPW
jgi:hypothetical protein